MKIDDHIDVKEVNKVKEVNFEESESIGKTKKKSKPNNKRFDDNKVSDHRDATSKIKVNKKRPSSNQKQPQQIKQTDKPIKNIVYTGSLTVGELAKKLGKEPSEIIKNCYF